MVYGLDVGEWENGRMGVCEYQTNSPHIQVFMSFKRDLVIEMFVIVSMHMRVVVGIFVIAYQESIIELSLLYEINPHGCFVVNVGFLVFIDHPKLKDQVTVTLKHLERGGRQGECHIML